MSTGLLSVPPQRVRLYRALWNRLIIVMMALFDLGAGRHPVKWGAVASVLMIDKKTAWKYLDGLLRDGFLALSGGEYMLSAAGMEFLHETVGGEILPESGEKFSPLKEVVVEDNINIKLLTSTTSTKEGEIPPEIGETFSPEVQTALKHVPLLFDGQEITLRGLPYYLHIEKVMGWIAYVYDQRAVLSRPCGLLYSKLRDKDGPYPPKKYLTAKLSTLLPEEYLDAIGKYSRICDWCKQEFTSLAGYNEHREKCVLTRHEEQEEQEETCESQPDETVTAEALTIWERVLSALKDEMPKASFETWVQSTYVLHWEPSQVRIGTRNSYAKEWLDARLTASVERLLSEMCKRAVKVTFVAGK